MSLSDMEITSHRVRAGPGINTLLQYRYQTQLNYSYQYLTIMVDYLELPN
jgi:hypothetical protein